MTNAQRALVKRAVTRTSVYIALKWSGNTLIGKRERGAKWETVFSPEQARLFHDQYRKLPETIHA